MSPSSPLVALLLADARLPAAGHTQSGGLEPGLAHGLAADDVPGYCADRLATVVRTEAATAVVTRHHLAAHGLAGPHGVDVRSIEAAWAARTPSDAMRDTSRTLGRGLLRLARRVWPDVTASWTTTDRPPRPVVLGAVAAATELAAHDLARVIAYDDVQTVLAAALKLTPLDPALAVVWAWDLLPEIDRLADHVAMLTAAADIPATSAPTIEAWAQAHARTTRRLFSA